jgi:hypothetical protein
MDEQARKDLRAKAEAATEGEWYTLHFDASSLVRSDDDDIFSLIETHYQEDAAFIAAANPQTVIALLDEVERLRQENDIRAQALRDIRKVGHNVYPNRDVTYYQDALWDIETCCAQASIDLQKLDDADRSQPRTSA